MKKGDLSMRTKTPYGDVKIGTIGIVLKIIDYDHLPEQSYRVFIFGKKRLHTWKKTFCEKL